MTFRNSDQLTSRQSAEALDELAGKLRARIVQLARSAGRDGLTINEAERLIPEHKNHSISPRFIEVIERGQLVRALVSIGKPTKRFPAGRPIYRTRFDDRTKRNVLVHWVPDFVAVRDTPALNSQGGLFV